MNEIELRTRLWFSKSAEDRNAILLKKMAKIREILDSTATDLEALNEIKILAQEVPSDE